MADLDPKIKPVYGERQVVIGCHCQMFSLSWPSVYEATYTNGILVLCNVRYPPETHLKLKSREISFAHNFLINYSIISKFCTEHGSDTAVLGAKL